MEQDPNKPVAYDANGRPLYAAPQVAPTPAVKTDIGLRSSHVTAAPETSAEGYDPQIRVQYANEPEVVHAARAIDLSETAQQRHRDSVNRYPFLNLSENEYVILDIRRHPIGLALPIFVTGLSLLALTSLLVIYPANVSVNTGATTIAMPSFGAILLPVLLFMLLICIGWFIAVWVYLQNQFFLTNESVIQRIQHSLFSRHEQTVSLGSIEDASFKQSGILQTLLNYATIRLSTEGEETTYRFLYVADPHKQVSVLNNAIEAFKNGRPVDMYET